MTSATLARGPPVDVRQEDDDDEDALMDEEELASLNSPGGQGNGREQEMERGGGRGLMIDENDGDSNSEEGINSVDDVVDYSGRQKANKRKQHQPAPSSGSLSDTEGDNEMGNGNPEAGYLQDYGYGRNGGDNNGTYPSAGSPAGSLSGAKGGSKSGKSFICDICMKTFSNAANMRRHRVRHSGIKPFECRFCQKRFFRKDHMREHMNHKHNNTQMECYFCQQVFDKEKDLFQHVTRDHDVNPRELHCQYCSFSATTIGRFLWHMTTSHPRKNSHYSLNDSPTDHSAISMAPSVHSMAPPSPDSPPSPSPKARPSFSDPYQHLSQASHSQTSSPSKRRKVAEDLSAHSTLNGLAASLNRSFFGGSTSTPSSDLHSLARSRSSNALNGNDPVRYVSILPNKFSSSIGDTSAEDLSNYSRNNNLNNGSSHNAEDYSEVHKMLARTQTHKMNGNTNSALVAAAFAAASAAQKATQNNNNPNSSSNTSSSRRKSKAPVRMVEAEAPVNGTGNGSGCYERVDTNGGSSVGFTQNNHPEDYSGGSRMTAMLQQRPIKQEKEALLRSPVDSADSEAQKCPHCLITYPDNVLYMLHKMLHGKDHPYKCAQCSIPFPNRYEFYAHIVNHGSPAPLNGTATR
ncbi:hypothetical protein RvY_14847 [Ramazzottius varieornatus]|uniref:C2H2-type domain-containing protein n=1 Tax=Ramazzottius varieornatus TaxID=947166 RepID=A0A1D1VWE5_RAMVA|nr:hypothetical protein RvY_14847 [Ramazzottius varieornatus]